MEVLAYILAIGLIVYGFYSMGKQAREKGIGSVVLSIIVIILLAAFG